jgi:hypothetical protein
MRASVKVGLVAGGYAAALAIAFAMVAIYIVLTDGPDRQASGGMYSFSDSLLFLAVFGVAAVPSTGGALFFLRPYPAVWRALSVAALASAAIGLVAIAAFLADQRAAPGSPAPWWSIVAVLRILLAPLLALFFFVAVLFAPNRSGRITMFVVSVIEAVVFASFVVIMILRR